MEARVINETGWKCSVAQQYSLTVWPLSWAGGGGEIMSEEGIKRDKIQTKPIIETTNTLYSINCNPH